jgi:hypothetical protein
LLIWAKDMAEKKPKKTEKNIINDSFILFINTIYLRLNNKLQRNIKLNSNSLKITIYSFKHKIYY